MNKSELIAYLAKTTELSPIQAEKVINAFIDTIINQLSVGGSVSIPNFGKFLVSERLARQGRNPRTGLLIEIEESKKPIFKAGNILKVAIESKEVKSNSILDRFQFGDDKDFQFKFLEPDNVSGMTLPEGIFSGNDILPSLNYAVMEVFFATDRKQNRTSDIKSLFGVERGELQYGTTQVSIPRDHRMGELESPSIWKLEFREDPEKHVVMLDITHLNKSDYYEAVSKKVNSTSKQNAFIFIHGYNVTFEEAAKRTAQIAYDLGFDGAPVFYSWPSNGSAAKYPFDEENILWAQSNIEKFLEDFLEKSNAENIYLIAHSMGNRALTRAYISVINKKPKLKSRFKEIILAAPDIDADVFKRDIAPAMLLAGNPITLYASSKDLPLSASRKFHGGHPRAGESGENLIVLSGIESIDSTFVETGFLGHSYYADERSVIGDMFYILAKSLRANERSGLNEINGSKGVYWEFKK